MTKIVDDTGNVFSVGVGRINESNTVAYSYDPQIGYGLTTIATYQNGTRNTVVTGANYWPPVLGSINNAGTVSFAANVPGGHYGALTRNDTTTNIVTGATGNSPVLYTLGQMSGNGSVAFSSFSANSTTLYFGNGGALTTIATTAVGGGFSMLDPGGPVVNEAGMIAFYGAKNGESSGYYLSDGNSSKRLFAPGGDVTPVAGTLSLNNDLNVAFSGTYVDSASLTLKQGIFLGKDSHDNQVVLIGDLLFGRTVSDLKLSKNSLNDNGQISFVATFTDGTEALVLATPVPEPKTYAMMLSGLGLLGFVAKRRKKSAA